MFEERRARWRDGHLRFHDGARTRISVPMGHAAIDRRESAGSSDVAAAASLETLCRTRVKSHPRSRFKRNALFRQPIDVPLTRGMDRAIELKLSSDVADDR